MKFTKNPKKEFLFKSINYKLLFLSIFTIVFGFILMTGGGSEDPNIFNDEIFNFRRIRIAPTIVLIGFVFAVFSILKTPNKK